MRLPDWLRRPRQVMLVFLTAAVASTGLLAWLTLQLLAQDRAAEQQRRRERLEQAVDGAVLEMERRLGALEGLLDSPVSGADALPVGVIAISWDDDGLTITPSGGLLYRPPAAAPRVGGSAALDVAERLELVEANLDAAARAYTALTAAGANPTLQAMAWTRLARVHRKAKDHDAALDAYSRLETFDALMVDGLPAALIASAGRASMFAEANDFERLREEAKDLADELEKGALPLTRSQYTFYASEVGRWLGAPLAPDAGALARADAVEWLWTRRAVLAPRDRRILLLLSGAVLLSWTIAPGGADGSVLVTGARALDALGSAAVPRDLGWAITDLEGRFVAGQAPPLRLAVTRTSAATNLPWTVHVFEAAGNLHPDSTARRTLRLFVIASAVGLLGVGWYFTWRGISRELRLARLQSDFVAAVSHEFRSPLTSLRHIAELLVGDRFASEEQRRRSYAVLAAETNRLSRLVEGLLDYARFEAGAVTVRLGPTPLDDLVRSVVGEFQSRADAAKRLTAAPSGLADLVVSADRDWLARALGNLLENALKYSPSGSAIHVSVRAAPASATASIAVSDHGLGISTDEQRTIFDRFVRGSDATSHRIPGTGIGLALVKEIMRAHGGSVAVRSEPGVGSTFTLTLPLANDAPASSAQSVGVETLALDTPGGQEPTR
jgi:signal transduction histidine kinase